MAAGCWMAAAWLPGHEKLVLSKTETHHAMQISEGKMPCSCCNLVDIRGSELAHRGEVGIALVCMGHSAPDRFGLGSREW